MRVEYDDAVKISRLLYEPTVVSFDFPFERDRVQYPILITRVRRPNAHFAMCTIGNRTLMTQNLRKPSGNTTWVTAVPGRQLTWIMMAKGRGYLGKVTREVRDHEFADYKVYKFYPNERIVYEETERL